MYVHMYEDICMSEYMCILRETFVQSHVCMYICMRIYVYIEHVHIHNLQVVQLVSHMCKNLGTSNMQHPYITCVT